MIGADDRMRAHDARMFARLNFACRERIIARVALTLCATTLSKKTTHNVRDKFPRIAMRNETLWNSMIES